MAAGRWWGAVGEGPTVPVRARAEPGVEVPHGSGDVPIFHIKQTYPVAQPPQGPNPSHRQGCGEDAATATTALCIPPAEPPHDSTPQHSNPGQNSHRIKAGRARPVCRIQEELLRSPCLLLALCQGASGQARGPREVASGRVSGTASKSTA